MEIARVDQRLMDRFPDVAKTAADLERIGHELSAFGLDPVERGDPSFRGLSWRCKSIANANVLRGEELFRFALLAVNEGALITANVLARALDETVAAVIFAEQRIQKARDARDTAMLVDLMNRLTCGNRFLSMRNEGHPMPFSVMAMIDEMGRYLETLEPSIRDEKGNTFRENYERISEIVHPSQGSFAHYQRLDGGSFHFDRRHADKVELVRHLLSSLRMTGYLLLTHARTLAATADLPADWPCEAAL